MSWDVLLLRLPDCIASVQDIPDGYLPPPLGRRRDVLAAVTRAVPGAGLADPDRGELRGPTWSMGLDIGSTDPVDSIMLHVRGSGDDALTTVFRLAEALHCKVLDCSEGELINPGGTPGWHAFQQYRDRVTSSVH